MKKYYTLRELMEKDGKTEKEIKKAYSEAKINGWLTTFFDLTPLKYINFK